MSAYISDITKTHWMVSNPARITRTGMDGKPFRCPFCPGAEADTPPEVYRTGEGEANKPGWKIRVIPNLFPITDVHEVVIHSPNHNKNIEDLSHAEVQEILKTYVARFNFLKTKGKVFIFCNQSLASGASLIHPHSQITVVPNDIATETLVDQPIVNVVEQKGEFVSYCPEYSEWAYECWIKENVKNQPIQPGRLDVAKFENLNETQIKDLAKILQSSLIKLKKIYDDNPHYSKKPFGYNFYISVPSSPKGVLEQSWYLRIIPRFCERAGFELSTGIMVNSIDPKKANMELRNVFK